VEPALLPVAGKRHLEERPVKAGSGCRGPHDSADALQEAHDGQRTVFDDASLQVFRSPEVRGSPIAWPQVVHRRQHEIVEIPSVGLEALEETAV
jgi:hypothetical protein